MKKWFIPEVVQTSSLDCGPASLKALLAGFGRPASYERLRDDCQTGLDGTAIETLETVALQRGLDAEQIVLPLDHLAFPQAGTLPAIVVVVVPPGLTHFVVVWRRLGKWLQIMDPALGRRWVSISDFLKSVYVHRATVDAQDWLAFASSKSFQQVTAARARALGIRLAHDNPGDWHYLAARDAALRQTQAALANGAVRKGRCARQMVEQFLRRPESIASDFWPVADLADGQVEMRGAVLLRVTNSDRPLHPQEEPQHVVAQVTSTLFRARGLLWPLLLTATLAAAAGTFVEALLFRGLLDINAGLALAGQRMGAVGAALLFCVALLLLEFPAFVTGVRLGRLLENRFRILFLEKLPRLGDQYFRSRSIADLAERGHVIHRLRHLPDQVRQLLLALCQLVITAAGIAWLEPRAWPLLLICLAGALIPIANAYWLLPEHALRMRTHSGGLMRYYLDAMLGLMPIRMHAAAAMWQAQHARLLTEWQRAGLRLQKNIVAAEALQLSVMFASVAAILLTRPFSASELGRALLIAYWALNMPALGQQIAAVTRQYPNYRGILLRLLEPLAAREQELSGNSQPFSEAPAIELEHVDVTASGNAVLTDISLRIDAGSHVAIVGPSGAGKSSLAGLLLGWWLPLRGQVRVNDLPIDISQVRHSTAWVDPAIQLWNTSLQQNLLFGSGQNIDYSAIIDAAALREVLEKLPEGLQTNLGENGGLVSGGEGQRVRFGRALARKEAKLVILDEPFRGLARQQRRELLRKARAYWPSATLLCITHDLSETRDFDQVIVMENGCVAESGSPQSLVNLHSSRYSQLLAAEDRLQADLWASPEWRRLTLEDGELSEEVALVSSHQAVAARA